MKKIYSWKELENLGIYKKNSLSFDLSAVEVDKFQIFLNSLYQYGNLIKGLEFNRDLFEKNGFSEKENKNPKPKILTPTGNDPNSYQTLVRIVPDLIGLLSRILPKTECLKKLKFCSIPIFSPEIDVFCQSMELCKSLRVLCFSGIKLYDTGFKRLSRSLHKRGIIKLKCRNCGLTDAIIPDFISLLSCHTKIQKIAEAKDQSIGIICLASFDFRDNNFTNKFVNAIETPLDESPALILDLRGNLEIQPNDVNSPKIRIFDPIIESDSLSQLQNISEKDLIKENQKLREKLFYLLQQRNYAFITNDIIAIGDRAQELCEYCRALEFLSSKLEENVKPKKKKKNIKRKKHVYLKRKKIKEINKLILMCVMFVFNKAISKIFQYIF